jgi:hypothetical protein
MNNEAKVRRSTRSVVLDKAKVMSYKDIEEARAKRAAKEVTKGKGKRDRKCKSAALEAGEPESDLELELELELELDPEPEPEPEVARAAKEVITGRGKRSRKRKIATPEAGEPEPEVARMIEAPELWRGASGADDLSAGCGGSDCCKRSRKSLLCSLVRMGFLRQGRAGFATSSCASELVFVVFLAQ